METRLNILKLRLNDDEIRTLDRVASEHGLDRPSLLRMLVARERRQLFGSAPTKKDAR